VKQLDEDSARTVADEVGRGFHSVHDQIREMVAGMDRRALSWKPHPEANSITVLVVHTLGSEREMLRAVRAIPTERDRPAEFMAEGEAGDLVALLDQVDQELHEHIASMTGADLSEMRPRGDRPPRPGLEWLLQNYGHAREHLAQMELTKQLYGAAR
jgi:DinB family protein